MRVDLPCEGDLFCPCEKCTEEEVKKVEAYRTEEAFLQLCFPEEVGGEA